LKAANEEHKIERSALEQDSIAQSNKFLEMQREHAEQIELLRNEDNRLMQLKRELESSPRQPEDVDSDISNQHAALTPRDLFLDTPMLCLGLVMLVVMRTYDMPCDLAIPLFVFALCRKWIAHELSTSWLCASPRQTVS